MARVGWFAVVASMVAAIVIAAGIWWAVGTPAQAEDPALGPPITVTRIGPPGTESPSPDDNNPLTPTPEAPDTPDAPDMLDIGALEVPPAPPPIAGNDDDDIDDNADADDVNEVDDRDSDEVFDNHDDGGEKTDGD